MKVLDFLEEFYYNFTGEKGIIGKTVLDKPIYYFKVFKSEYPKIIVTAGIHAREYITTYLSLELIKDFAKFGEVGTVYFVPAVNVDGIKIATSKRKLYKANYRRVDLNVNFDAKFSKGEKNVKYFSDENFIGPFAFSEPETLALKNFTEYVKPNLTISYHSKGQEIYYNFYQNKRDIKRDLIFAKIAQEKTQYKIVELFNSSGGYKDWCIRKFGIPSLTIEVGSDRLSHPIQRKRLNKILKENRGLINALSLALKDYERKIYASCNKRSKKMSSARRSAYRRDNSI